MKKGRKSLLAVVLTLAMALSMIVPAMAQESMSGKLVVIHTNDMHGYYETNENSIGIAGIASLKDYYEDLGADVLLLDAGDFSQGKTLVSYFKGANAAKYIVAAGYDAVSLGNHEFDFGYDAFIKNTNILKEGGVAVLDANVLKKGTNDVYFNANKVFEFDGVKVGVFGLDTAETLTKASPLSVKDVDFADGEKMFEIAQAQVDALKAEGCDFIICLGHLGVDDESAGRRSTDLVQNVKGIDLMVDGHSHTKFENGEKVADTLIVSTGNYLENAGVVTYDKASKSLDAKLISAADYAAEIGKYDETVAKLVTDDVATVNAAYSAIIGKTTVDLNGNKAPGVRTEETNLGDFAADAYLYAAREYVKEHEMNIDVVAAISNGGGIRASIPAGDISMDTLCTVFPFGNTISIVTLKGSQLLEVLEASTNCTPTAIGGFPQVSGIVYEINTGVEFVNGEQYPDSTYYAPANPGSRVTIKSVGGKAFDPNADYTIAVNNFLAAGGDTYYVLTKASFNYDTEVVDSEALISYVINGLGGVIGDQYKEPQGRITIIPAAAVEESVKPAEPAKPVTPVGPETTPVEAKDIYVVVKGDSLWKIAKAELGNGQKWINIYNDNKAEIANPELIYVGQELVINK